MIMNEPSITASSIYTMLSQIISMITTTVGNVISTITGNPLFFVPVLLCLGAGVATIAIKVVRKFGLNGIGRRRRGRKVR